MSQDSNQRIAADILIAQLRSQDKGVTAADMASAFQTLYNQVKYSDHPEKKPGTITEAHKDLYS